MLSKFYGLRVLEAQGYETQLLYLVIGFAFLELLKSKFTLKIERDSIKEM